MPTVADRAVREKVTKGRAGVRWDRVVEKGCKGIGGNQKDMLSIDKFVGFKTVV